MTPGELLDKRGIHLESTAPGRYYTTCPQCSKDRTKPGHKNAKCLGVTIDGDKVGWGCNHCGWTGPEKGSGRRERTSTVVCYYAYGEKLRKARGANKLFWWEHLDGGGRWIKGSGGADTKILYRIDEVRRAIADGRTIAVAEGEKDAESLWNIGVPATCNAHGASEPGYGPGPSPRWALRLICNGAATCEHRASAPMWSHDAKWRPFTAASLDGRGRVRARRHYLEQ